MKTLFSTAHVHPRDGHAYWHDALCRKMTRHDFEPGCRANFWGELQGGLIAGMHVFVHKSSPMAVRRTTRHIDHTDTDELFVARQQAGRHLIEQAGQEVFLEDGDFALVDSRQPMQAKHFAGSRLLLLKVPRRELEARIGRTQYMSPVAIRVSRPEHALTSAFLAMLPAYTDTLAPAMAEVVRGQALDLLAVSVAKAANAATPRVSSARGLVLVNLRAAIEARLSDPTLDSETVAAAAGVSVRYANAVLADMDTSIMQLIRTRRLDRCRRALEDSAQAARTIGEIAYGWGFSDMTHFSRCFRAAFGSLPSEYRRMAKPG